MAAQLKVSVEGKGADQVLVVRIPMQKPKASASGKTLVVATTHGNIETEAEVNGETIKLGLNAYIPNPDR
jgi:hypothetical protein